MEMMNNVRKYARLQIAVGLVLLAGCQGARPPMVPRNATLLLEAHQPSGVTLSEMGDGQLYTFREENGHDIMTLTPISAHEMPTLHLKTNERVYFLPNQPTSREAKR